MNTLNKSLLFCVLLFSASTHSAWAMGKPNRPDAAPSILAAFQGSCGSQGIFTQSANSQTAAIINIFQSLKDTDACKNFTSELTSVSNAVSSLQSIQNSSTYAPYQTDQNQYQLLTVALQNGLRPSQLLPPQPRRK